MKLKKQPPPVPPLFHAGRGTFNKTKLSPNPCAPPILAPPGPNFTDTALSRHNVTRPASLHPFIKPLTAPVLAPYYSTPPPHQSSPRPTLDMTKKAILYHTNWANYARNFQVKDIPIEGVTDIAYAFFNLQDSGNGQWEIVSGDRYYFSVLCLIVVGLILIILLREVKGFLLRTHGTHRNRRLDFLENSTN